MIELPDWIPGCTLYQLHALGAAGVHRSNPDVAAAQPISFGLATLTAWLDQVSRLGCGGVLLTPIFVSGTHGYDTVDAARIDQRLGDDGSFDAFVAACHERDLRLVLDGVFNHVGREFGPFVAVRTQGLGSAYADWFVLDGSRDDGDGFGYGMFEGHHGLVALNHTNPAVLDWAAEVALRWLSRGADGWRLDAAYAIPTEFLAALSSRIRARYPNALVFAEKIHGDYAGFADAAGMHAVTQYELHKAIWSSLNDANFFELAWALERHPAVVGLTFVGNHDVTRVASQLRDQGLLAPALALQFTVPGIPCVYYGDEYGWRGIKQQRAGGDDEVRPALPADPPQPGWIYDMHHDLIALRGDHPWLTTAHLEVLEIANARMSYAVRADGRELRVLLDLDVHEIPVPDGCRELYRAHRVLICEPT